MTLMQIENVVIRLSPCTLFYNCVSLTRWCVCL